MPSDDLVDENGYALPNHPARLEAEAAIRRLVGPPAPRGGGFRAVGSNAPTLQQGVCRMMARDPSRRVERSGAFASDIENIYGERGLRVARRWLAGELNDNGEEQNAPVAPNAAVAPAETKDATPGLAAPERVWPSDKIHDDFVRPAFRLRG